MSSSPPANSHRHSRRATKPVAAVDNSAQLRTENILLRQKLAKLAALVDHYYCAHLEAQTRLAPREQEIAELLRNLELKPRAIRSR